MWLLALLSHGEEPAVTTMEGGNADYAGAIFGLPDISKRDP